jgi:hypothetical protein
MPRKEVLIVRLMMTTMTMMRAEVDSGFNRNNIPRFIRETLLFWLRWYAVFFFPFVVRWRT